MSETMTDAYPYMIVDEHPDFRPVVYVPWPSALPFADDVLPHFLEIARTGVPFLHLPYGFADRMRNEAAKRFLASNYTHLIMLDADHQHPADIVKRLMYWFEQDPERDIVAGLNFKRCAPYDPCAFVNVDGRDACLMEWELGLVEVDAVGAGSIAITRRVFDALAFPWFVNEPDLENMRLGSHDRYFCNLAQAAGFRVYVDTALTSPHMASHTVGELSYRSWQETHPVPRDQTHEM